MPTKKRVLLVLGWYEEQVHSGIAQYALKAGWHLCADATREKSIPWGWQGDGILAWLASGDDFAEFVCEANLPTVDFSYRRRELPFPRVLTDQAAAAELVADHFITRGFKNYIYYCEQEIWVFKEAGDAFINALDRVGLKCERLIGTDAGPATNTRDHWKEKRRWLAQRLKKIPKPLAVFTSTDYSALEIVEICEENGFSVPEDVSVMGMGNCLPAVEAMHTPISSVDQNFEVLGYRAAELLDRLMQGKPGPAAPIRIPPKGLVSRKSSDLMALNHPQLARCMRFIWENCHRPIGVDDLAEVAGMSRSGLHKSFLQHFYRTPGAELHRVRIESAKKLLADFNLKLGEVSERSGYQNANSFWIAFRKATGMTPKQYRASVSF